MKQEQQDGWLDDHYSNTRGCVNYPDESWDDIDLDCDVADELEKASKTQSLLAEIMPDFHDISSRI